LLDNIKIFFCKEICDILKSLDKNFFLSLEEIRLRVNKPIVFKNQTGLWTVNNKFILSKNILSGYLVTQKNLSESLELMTNYSPYAFENEISNGFISLTGGHRVGLSGEVIIENKNIRFIKNISSINFRIAHEIKNCACEIINFIAQKKIYNTIIISGPGTGKTTMLRDVIRLLAQEHNISIIDERSELAGCHNGIAQNDLGILSDILDRCPKTYGMNLMLRTMSPEIIAVDEIGTREDANAILNIFHSGVKIICTAHGESLEDIKSRNNLSELIQTKIFERYIILDNISRGKIKNIFDKNFLCLL